mgnify:FL=1
MEPLMSLDLRGASEASTELNAGRCWMRMAVGMEIAHRNSQGNYELHFRVGGPSCTCGESPVSLCERDRYFHQVRDSPGGMEGF